jgi:hypothetical protein
MKLKYFGLVIMICLSSIYVLGAQDTSSFFTELQQEEKEAIEALVLYPEATRLAILEVCLYPEAIIKLQRIQSKSSEAFGALVAPLPRQTQETIWDLARYPGLIHQLSAVNRQIDGNLSAVLEQYPEDIHARAQEATLHNALLLDEIDAIELEAEYAFQQVLIDYPEKTQTYLQELLELPEVLDLLTNNISLTVLVGVHYRQLPDQTVQQLDSLNLVVAREQARELESWKEEVESNPDAAQELKQAAQTYAEEYQFDDAYYDYDDLYYDTDNRQAATVHHYYHYPYWFGYPQWYDYPCWRPYPLWPDWGFSTWTSTTIIIVRLPSYHFVHWYFNQPSHHIWWPHLSGRFVRHYYYHPRHHSGLVMGVSAWRERNREVISDRWMEEAANNPRRFQEYGEFEYNRLRYNQRRPETALSPGEFLDRNPRAYPDLERTSVARAPIKPEPRRTEPTPSVEPSTKRPSTLPTPSETRSKDAPVPTKQVPRTQPDVEPPPSKATDRHRTIWEPPPSRITKPVPKTTPRIERRPPAPPKKPTARSSKSGDQPASKRSGGL